jgi:hypothetical protein
LDWRFNLRVRGKARKAGNNETHEHAAMTACHDTLREACGRTN